MSDTVIKVEGLSKSYQLGQKGADYGTLRDSIMGLFRSKTEEQKASSTIWALDDLSFELQRGEILGVIGRNGAGKSTLLKILSRITEPTKGKATIHGRVGALLEVGTGFHPELTGRENVFLNGAILGMKKAEIQAKFDRIVAFAELEQFIDTPVKFYSSGMYVRLAFSVAAHLEPDILLIDEVLAVGDIEFQKKCIGQMESVARDGKTVLLVGHNMSTIKALCNKGILIEGGQKKEFGNVDDVVRKYMKFTDTDGSIMTFKEEDHDQNAGRKIRCQSMEILNGVEKYL